MNKHVYGLCPPRLATCWILIHWKWAILANSLLKIHLETPCIESANQCSLDYKKNRSKYCDWCATNFSTSWVYGNYDVSLFYKEELKQLTEQLGLDKALLDSSWSQLHLTIETLTIDFQWSILEYLVRVTLPWNNLSRTTARTDGERQLLCVLVRFLRVIKHWNAQISLNCTVYPKLQSARYWRLIHTAKTVFCTPINKRGGKYNF